MGGAFPEEICFICGEKSVGSRIVFLCKDCLKKALEDEIKEKKSRQEF